MTSTDIPGTQTRSGWLSDDEIRAVRAHLPVVYVEVVPVRVDGYGQITAVGLLLAPTPDGSISRTLVSGRILHGERVREAVLGPRLAATGWFDRGTLSHLIDAHQSGARDYSAPLWTLLMFEAFLRNVVDDQSATRAATAVNAEAAEV